MKILKAFLAAFVVVGVLTGSLESKEPEGIPPEIKGLMEKAIETRRDLYKKFLPPPEDLGPGWLLPWQIPASLRKFDSEEKFWQSTSEFSQSGFIATGSAVSWLLEASPEQIEKFLEMFVVSPEIREIPVEELHLPPGVTPEQSFLAGILLGLQKETSTSLAERAKLAWSNLEESQKAMQELMSQEEATGEEEPGLAQKRYEQRLVEAFLKPVKGMSSAEIKQAIQDEAASTSKMSAMVYTKCDNWEALKSGEEDPSKLHLGVVVVKLIILDRNRMEAKIDDLDPEEVGQLQHKLNQHLRRTTNLIIEMRAKEKAKRIAELRQDLQSTEDSEARKAIQEKIREVEEGFETRKKSLSSIEMKVYTRDFADNCYVLSTKREIDIPKEFTLPFVHLSACLRNGNAVVLIGLGGNFAADQFQKELDHFLSEMDARTAFFRE